MAGAVPDDIAADQQRQLAAQLLSIEAELSQVTKVGDVHRRALDMVLELIKDAGRTYSKVDDKVRRSLNQAWFDYLEVDEDEGVIHVADTGRSELTAALTSAIGRIQRQRPDNEERRRSECFDGVDRVRCSNYELWWSSPE